MRYTIKINEKKIIVNNFLTTQGRTFIFRRIFAKSPYNYLVFANDSTASDPDKCDYAFNFIDSDGFVTPTVDDTLEKHSWKFFNPDADLVSHSIWIPGLTYIQPSHATIHSDSDGTRYTAYRDGAISAIALVSWSTRQFPVTLISIGIFPGSQPVKAYDDIYVGYELSC